MSRFKGHGIINTTYDVNYWGPLDSRFLVSSKEDLYLEATWKPSPVHTLNCYNGMIVAVANDERFEGIFCLTDMKNFDLEESWIQLDGKNPSGDPSSSNFKTSIVDRLPIAGEADTLYLVRTSNSSPNRYIEYLWVENNFEVVGSISSDTYSKAEIDALLNTVMNQLRNEFENYAGGSGSSPELEQAIGALQSRMLSAEGSILTHSSEISTLNTRASYLEASVENKVDRKWTDEGEWTLVSPSDKAKLAALTFNGSDLEISATVSADKVVNLSGWIGDNRDAISGLLSSQHESYIDAISALLNSDGTLTASKISGLSTWISDNRDTVDGLLKTEDREKLDSALTDSSPLKLSKLEQDVDIIILETY